MGIINIKAGNDSVVLKIVKSTVIASISIIFASGVKNRINQPEK